MGAADAHDAGFKAKVEEAGAHDAGWPGGSRPKGGAADAHDAGSPRGSRPKQGQLMLMMRAGQGVS